MIIKADNIPKSTKVMDVAKFLAYCDREGFYEIAETQYRCDRSALQGLMMQNFIRIWNP